MQMLTSLKYFVITGAAFALAACSSTPDQQEIAESFAKQRAAMLSNVVPVEMQGYTLVRAKADGSQIEMTLLYSGDTKNAPSDLTDAMVNRYCNDNEVYSLMEQGVSYKLLIRDMRGRPVTEKVVDTETCDAR